MDLELSEEQRMLSETLRKLLEAECPPQAVRELEDDAFGYSPKLWETLAAMGIAGLTLPEGEGGAGLGAIDLAVVHEELGRALCPTPHLASSVIAAGILLRAGSAEQKRRWLPAIASGKAILVPAWLEPGGGFGPQGIQLAVTAGVDRYAVSGTKFCVPFAGAATRLLVLGRSGSGKHDIDLLLVDPKARGVTLTQLRTLASDAQYELRFDAVEVLVSDRIGPEGGGWALWQAAQEEAQIALAAWAVGCGSRAHEMATAYAKDRVQFGKPIGGFQAIAHPLASVAMELEGARALVHQAAWTCAQGRPSRHLAAMAKLGAEAANLHATEVGHQVLGGIGFTLGVDMQLYFRRARQSRLAWGDRDELLETVGTAILDGEC